jgi:hypothetical protein
MAVRGDEDFGEERRRQGKGDGLLLAALTAAARALERESDRWVLWLPVLFAGGIVTQVLYIEGLSIRAVSVASAPGHRPLGPRACVDKGIASARGK